MLCRNNKVDRPHPGGASLKNLLGWIQSVSFAGGLAMLTRLFSLLALAGLATTLNAQTLVGTWQGTLVAGQQNLRLVFKISAGPNDKLTAINYSIDQGARPIPVTTVAQDGSAVKMTIAPIGGSYEGKLSEDGNTITGNWSQGNSLPLVLTRATPQTAWDIPEPPPPPKTMPADAKPHFEVTTIKPSQNPQGFGFTVNRSGWLTTHNTSLKDLIKIAYGLHPKQITGGPGWIEEDKYDIVGKPDTEGLPSLPQLMDMVKSMLPERFHLAFHNEKKELSAYALTIGKLGLKITEEKSNPNGLPGFGGGGPRGLRVVNATMQEFAEFLQANVLDQPVVDQTGLDKKRYTFIVKWTPDGAPADSNLEAPPDIYTAFQQQLGLGLSSTKAPVDLFVIDKVEKPTGN
jgi:uncharacterized protein (TIGR03435 family)